MALDKATNQVHDLTLPRSSSVTPGHKVTHMASLGIGIGTGARFGIRIDGEPPVVSLVNSSLVPDGSLLANSTPSSLPGVPGLRTVHMQPRITANNHPPQYGTFYTEYDPMTGARTAAFLGSLLLLLVIYIVYKAKCNQPWNDEDDYYLQQYKQRQAIKMQAAADSGNQHQSHRRGTSYIIDPVCSPDPTILAATAKWIQMQPLEDAVTDPDTGAKRQSRPVMSKFLSYSAERINRHVGARMPLVPNRNQPPSSGNEAERSCNEYVPNGFLKYIHKETIQGPDWQHNDSQDSSGSGGPVEFYIEEEDRKCHAHWKSSCVDDIHNGENEIEGLLSKEEQKPRPKSGKHHLEHFSSLDRHNNNDELEDRTLQLEQSQDRHLRQDDSGGGEHLESALVERCTNYCTADKVNIEMQDLQSPVSLFIPPNHKILLTPTLRWSRLKSMSRQRSHDRASLESHQRSLDIDDDIDDSPDFSLSILPPRDPASVSVDISESSENASEFPQSSIIASVPMLSYIDNLTNNSTFSTMSTATASSNGSYQSEGATDIPLTDVDLVQPLARRGAAAAAAPQPTNSTVVEVTIETALPSSSKRHDMDNKL